MTSLGQEEIWNHLDSLTKPVRSLGRLEDLAARLCDVQQTISPRTAPRRIVLFAGDHGVAAAGVTAWPAEVTRLMIKNIRGGGAASSVLARQTQTDLVLIDVGVLGDEIADDGQSGGLNVGVRFRSCRIRPGTRDLSREPALTVNEFEQAFRVGRDQAKAAVADGMRVVAAGEMGIGNTTPAACLAMLLADVPLAEAVGRAQGPMMQLSTASARSSGRPSPRPAGDGPPVRSPPWPLSPGWRSPRWRVSLPKPMRPG